MLYCQQLLFMNGFIFAAMGGGQIPYFTCRQELLKLRPLRLEQHHQLLVNLRTIVSPSHLSLPPTRQSLSLDFQCIQFNTSFLPSRYTCPNSSSLFVYCPSQQLNPRINCNLPSITLPMLHIPSIYFPLTRRSLNLMGYQFSVG